MGLSVGGIVSGLDTTAMVAALVDAASTPKLILEDDLEVLEDKQQAFAGLANIIEEFQKALEAIDTVDELRAVSGTSNSSAVTVSLDGDAVIGSYDIQVNALASNEMEISQGYAEKDTDGAVPSGTLSITYGTTTTAITLEDTDTSLQNVADAINEQVDGVTAYIMDTGDATSPYRLVLVGDDTGAANTITLDTTGLTGATGTVPSFTETETAADASVTINGVTVVDDDNVIDTAIQGVSFNISSLTTSAATVTVARDDEKMIANIQAFVDSYNAVMTYIDTNLVFNPDEDIKGPFVGENLVRTVETILQRTLTGFYENDSSIQMLADLGITSKQDGDLTFDSAKFKEALDSDFDGVIEFFTVDEAADDVAGTTASFLNAVRGSLTLLIDADDGLLSAKEDALKTSIEDTNQRISDFDDYLAAYEARLTTNFTNMELTLARLQANQSALMALMPDTSSNSSSNDDN